MPAKLTQLRLLSVTFLRLRISTSTDLTDFSLDTLKGILAVDKDAWKVEADGIKEFYKDFGNKLPKELAKQADELKSRLV